MVYTASDAKSTTRRLLKILTIAMYDELYLFFRLMEDNMYISLLVNIIISMLVSLNIVVNTLSLLGCCLKATLRTDSEFYDGLFVEEEG